MLKGNFETTCLKSLAKACRFESGSGHQSQTYTMTYPKTLAGTAALNKKLAAQDKAEAEHRAKMQAQAAKEKGTTKS